MIQLPSEDLTPSTERFPSSSPMLSSRITPLHWVGYGLLIFAGFDVVDTLVPANFMNPAWELETIGSLVEQAPLILVGLVLAFLGDRRTLNPWERPVLRGLSWLALGIGLLYLLLIPLCIADSFRVYQQTNQELSTQVSQKRQVIQQVREQLNQTNTTADLEQFMSSFSNTGEPPAIDNPEQLKQMKDQLDQAIAQGEKTLNAQIVATQAEQRMKLIKKAVKWILGALVAGLLLISVWQGTRWARQDWQDG